MIYNKIVVVAIRHLVDTFSDLVRADEVEGRTLVGLRKMDRCIRKVGPVRRWKRESEYLYEY